MHSSTVVTLATCLIIVAIVTHSASALAFQGSQDRAKRYATLAISKVFWVDKKSANEADAVCVRPSAADNIVECFIEQCIEKGLLKCKMICGGESQQCDSLCEAKKERCAESCLKSHATGDVMGQ